MRRFLALLLIVFVLTGCNRNTQPGEAANELGPAVPTLGVPMPNDEILSALGPENDIPIQRLLPDTIFVAVGKPKQFLDSPVSTGGELLIADMIVRSLQLYSIDPNSIERFVQSNALPLPVLINVPHPQDLSAPPQQRIIPISRRATVITFHAPVDKSLLVTSVLGNNSDPAFIESLKRTEGRNEYYDLTPPNLAIPQRFAVGMLNEHTAVIAEGLETDIKAVFSDALPKNAVLDRIKHTPVGTNDLIILTSLEGLNISPEELEQLLRQMGETGYIPQSFAAAIRQHLRALTLSVNVSAAAGQPVVSVYAEGRNTEGAEAIGSAIRGVIILAQTTMATMNESAKQTLPIPPDFAVSVLNALSVEVTGTRVNAVLNNFETLLPTVAKGIRDQQTVMQQLDLQQRRAEQLSALAELSAAYYVQNQKFPADILDAEGKPLLSWRVALLPMMGLEDLYNKFKLDEPWDSETNKEWAAQMPIIYHPLVSDVALPKTVIRFFDSPGTPFANRNLKLDDLEFPQTTLMFVIVSPEYAVEWTKPESLEFNIEKIADILGDTLFGVAFSRQICLMPILPETDSQYEDWRRDVEALVRGISLESPEPQMQEAE